MIVLKILLWLLLAIIGIILLVLILPISAKASFIGGKFSYDVKFSFLSVLNSDGDGIVNRLKKRKKKKRALTKGHEDKKDTEYKENEGINNPVDGESDKPEEDIVYEDNIDIADKDDEIVKNFNISSDEKYNEAENFSDDDEDDISENGKDEKKFNIEFIIDLWEVANRPIQKILKGIKLSELYIDFAIANEDAYKCALNYGRISGAIYQLIGWLSVIFNVKVKTVDIIPAFALRKSRFDASVKVSLCLITPVIAGICFLITYIFKIYIPQRKKKKRINQK